MITLPTIWLYLNHYPLSLCSFQVQRERHAWGHIQNVEESRRSYFWCWKMLVSLWLFFLTDLIVYSLFWAASTLSNATPSFCRELRLRNYLGERYDAIPNVFDWDFQMKLSDKGVNVHRLFATLAHCCTALFLDPRTAHQLHLNVVISRLES